MAPLMDTDSEQLMVEGVATGVANFESLLTTAGLRREDLDRTVCHQVGGRHRQTMLAAMQLDPARDVVTYPWLGNTGSVALPLTLAAAAKFGQLPDAAQLGLFGIGSGINSVMLTARWGETPVAGNLPETAPVAVASVE